MWGGIHVFSKNLLYGKKMYYNQNCSFMGNFYGLTPHDNLNKKGFPSTSLFHSGLTSQASLLKATFLSYKQDTEELLGSILTLKLISKEGHAEAEHTWLEEIWQEVQDLHLPVIK